MAACVHPSAENNSMPPRRQLREARAEYSEKTLSRKRLPTWRFAVWRLSCCLDRCPLRGWRDSPSLFFGSMGVRCTFVRVWKAAAVGDEGPSLSWSDIGTTTGAVVNASMVGANTGATVGATEGTCTGLLLTMVALGDVRGLGCASASFAAASRCRMLCSAAGMGLTAATTTGAQSLGCDDEQEPPWAEVPAGAEISVNTELQRLAERHAVGPRGTTGRLMDDTVEAVEAAERAVRARWILLVHT